MKTLNDLREKNKVKLQRLNCYDNKFKTDLKVLIFDKYLGYIE